ncbi:MAG: hypothetical protein ACLU9T_15820 [Blautia faecis]
MSIVIALFKCFFLEFSELTKENSEQRKAQDYEMVKKLKDVRQVLRKNAMLLYTQMNGAVTFNYGKGSIITSWPQNSSLDYSFKHCYEKEMWDLFFENSITNYKWEIVNGRDAMSF